MRQPFEADQRLVHASIQHVPWNTLRHKLHGSAEIMDLLHSKRGIELSSLAVRLGLAHSGTKAEVARRIVDCVAHLRYRADHLGATHSNKTGATFKDGDAYAVAVKCLPLFTMTQRNGKRTDHGEALEAGPKAD